jgi:ferrous iron transport protein A
MTLRLDQLPYQRRATVALVDWSALTEPEQRRLRNLGLDEGVEVEALHGGPFGRDPMAVRIGRMTLAMRRVHARVVHVSAVAGADGALAPE